jgi:hypothetical protein
MGLGLMTFNARSFDTLTVLTSSENIKANCPRLVDFCMIICFWAEPKEFYFLKKVTMPPLFWNRFGHFCFVFWNYKKYTLSKYTFFGNTSTYRIIAQLKYVCFCVACIFQLQLTMYNNELNRKHCTSDVCSRFVFVVDGRTQLTLSIQW